MKEKTDYKSIVLSGSFGGLVYAILMSIFYQFTDDKGFSIIKFVIDFTMFGILIAVVIWWSMRKSKKNKNK
ncbi:hypothetical protein [Nonlabens dokdonensis]|uniref:Uncharacterized protein n=1 Tax=Nonlabens dokdonensis (strain DSM 17205 / KCTC 12402 / DSW-6) TaxID=592029 RepID=L7W912_NONDD|nr:hypothetical protein [Nonlabens dokdonensis]AGC78210.1 hypothetical protein DDD_3083 [Nonlabens dokdonensis DSW-6]